MGLIGDSSELPLPELIQAKGLSRGSCRVLVQGRQGEGVLYLASGAVVHAQYGSASGAPAALALLGEPSVAYRVTSDVALPPPNMQMDHRALLLEAAVRADHERRVGRAPPPAVSPVPRSLPAGRAAAAASPGRRSLLTAAAWGLALAVAAVLAVTGTVSFRRSEASATVQAPPEPPPAAPPAISVEASSLTGPGDVLPVLLTGEPPASPVPGLALRPTVVLRLLVDERGAVTRAEVYQHRAELSAFEMTALTAAQRFQFRPARRAGSPIAAWVNWPVDFL